MAQIRLATGTDAAAIASIYAPYVEHTVISFETVPPSPEEMSRRIADTTVAHPWLVCEREGAVVGYAAASPHRVRAAYRWSVEVGVYLGPEHHRRGMGRGLYTSLFEILRAQGFVNAYAGITLPNPASVGLHEAMGFRRIGVYERVGYKNAAWHDVGWWSLDLQAHPEHPQEPLALSAVQSSPAWERALRSGERVVRGAR